MDFTTKWRRFVFTWLMRKEGLREIKERNILYITMETSIQMFMPLRPCPRWNTSRALEVLWTYDGRCMRVSQVHKTVGCPYGSEGCSRSALLPSAASDFHPTVKVALHHESPDSEEDREGLGCHLGQGLNKILFSNSCSTMTILDQAIQEDSSEMHAIAPPVAMLVLSFTFLVCFRPNLYKRCYIC